MASTDPRYEYENIGPSSISVAMLDKIASAVFDPTTGVLGLVKALVMASFATAYVIVREKLIAQQAEYKKQQYEREQAGKNQGELDKDPLSGEKKP
jgi:hypothetical protein